MRNVDTPNKEATLRLKCAAEALKAADEGLVRAGFVFIARVLNGTESVKARTKLRAAEMALKYAGKFATLTQQRLEVSGPDQGPVQVSLVDLIREAVPEQFEPPRKRPAGQKDATKRRRKGRGRP